jgi:hypothetical protein
MVTSGQTPPPDSADTLPMGATMSIAKTQSTTRLQQADVALPPIFGVLITTLGISMVLAAASAVLSLAYL